MECILASTRTDDTPRPCVVYMHGNAGNCMEGLSHAPSVLTLGADLLTFDFSGCGNSEGEWVTLGWKEKDDLHSVLQYLESEGKTNKVVLWGRSMGAATVLLYDQQFPLPVTAFVLDSGFSDMESVATNLIQKMGMPVEFFPMLWPGVCEAVNQATGGLDLYTLRPVDCCADKTQPVLFIHGSEDELIPKNNTVRNFEKYGGVDKDVIYCSGTHNDFRSSEVIARIASFIQKHIA